MWILYQCQTTKYLLHYGLNNLKILVFCVSGFAKEECCGMEELVSGVNGVRDSALTASTFWDSDLVPSYGRLNGMYNLNKSVQVKH